MSFAPGSAWHELLNGVDTWQLPFDDPLVRSMERHAMHWLTPDERSHHDRLAAMPRQHVRGAYLAARVLCRATLSRYTGACPSDWRFRAGPHGKPAIAAPAEFAGLQFNLTHTHGLVACAVTRVGEVGVDAEETSRDVDVEQVSGHFFSPAEQAHLSRVPPAERVIRFFEQWVAKEAYLKARGTGLAEAPEGFTIAWDDDGQPLRLVDCHIALHRPDRSYVTAVAVRTPAMVGAAPLRMKWLTLRELSEAGIAVK